MLQGWVVTLGMTNNRKIFVNDNNTIGTIFNELNFLQTTSGGSADRLRIFTNGAYVDYFFKSDVQKWRLSSNRDGPDQENVVISNRSIIAFAKASSGSKTITLKGTARVSIYQ